MTETIQYDWRGPVAELNALLQKKAAEKAAQSSQPAPAAPAPTAPAAKKSVLH